MEEFLDTNFYNFFQAEDRRKKTYLVFRDTAAVLSEDGHPLIATDFSLNAPGAVRLPLNQSWTTISLRALPDGQSIFHPITPISEVPFPPYP